MKKQSFSVARLCVIAIMAAVYVLLAKLTIPIGNLHITLAPLAIMIVAAKLGTADGMIMALLGEFIIQATGQYGITPTTPLWCLPPVLRAAVVGIGCSLIHLDEAIGEEKQVDQGKLSHTVVLFYGIAVLAAILTTLANTGVIWADAVIFGYYSFAYVFGQLVIRLVTGAITAIVTATITLPVLRALRSIRL